MADAESRVLQKADSKAVINVKTNTGIQNFTGINDNSV